MKRLCLVAILITGLLLASLTFSTPLALAHRSGCHRWHSCQSDRGTYTCGDLGYCSQCSNNYFCHNGAYTPGWNTATINNGLSNSAQSNQSEQPFVGVPRTRAQLFS